jgi:hypothetical protein
MASSSKFSCLIRFRDPAGQVHYGDVKSPSNLVGQSARILHGPDIWNLEATTKEAQIAQILCPLSSTPVYTELDSTTSSTSRRHLFLYQSIRWFLPNRTMPWLGHTRI